MAQNTLEILIKASSSKARAELNSLGKTVKTLGSNSGSAFDTIKSKFRAMDAALGTPEGLKTMIGMAGAAATALIGLGAAAKKLADDYMDYAFQVKDFGRIIGATPEEASKLIQVADDVRLSVQSMTAAMRVAITRGYAPTIDGLGQLSDAYLAIQNPLERSKFLIDRFGRGGLEMAKLMELGSKKIEEMGDSIEGTSRLMTDEGIKAAEEYYKSLDALGDAWKNLTLIVGHLAMPVIGEVTDRLTVLAEGLQLLERQLNSGDKQWILTLFYITQIAQGGRYAAVGLEYFKNEMADLSTEADVANSFMDTLLTTTARGKNEFFGAASGAEKLIEKLGKFDEVDISLPDISGEITDWITSMRWEDAGGRAFEQFWSGLSTQFGTLGTKAAAALGAELSAIDLAMKVEAGDIDISDAVRKFQDAFGGKYGEAKTKIQAAIEADPKSAEDIRAFLLETLSDPANVTIAPILGTPEYDAMMNMFADMAAVDKRMEPLLKPRVSTDAYESAVELMSTPITVPLIPEVVGTGKKPIPPRYRPTKRELGGPVMPYHSYMVGEAGPELFVPNSPGKIITNQRLNNDNRSTVINNYFTVTTKDDTPIRELARLLTREQQRTGVR